MMTTDKAREFFSPYYEGSLEDGLRLSLEQSLREDPDLREEYDLFAQTMKELDTLGDFEAPVPFDLHDRIVARLEEVEQKKVVPMLTVWRNVAVGLVAASLIFGAIFSLKSRNTGGPDQASPLPAIGSPSKPVTPAPVKPTFNYSASKGLTIELQADRQVWLRVDTAPDNKQIQRLDVQPNQPVVAPLANTNADAAAFRVTVIGEPDEYYVALPGTVPSTTLSGDGTVLDMALALAGYYKTPVLLQTSKIGAKARWDFADKDVKAALTFGLNAQKSSFEVKDSGLVVIQDL